MSKEKRIVPRIVQVKLRSEEAQQLDEDGWIRLDGTVYLERLLKKENPT